MTSHPENPVVVATEHGAECLTGDGRGQALQGGVVDASYGIAFRYQWAIFVAVGETIKQSELRNNNAEIMRRVADGESFTVTVHGQPVAVLVPYQRPGRQRRRLVPAVEFDEAITRLPPVNVAQWKRDRAQADAIFGEDQPTDPWEEVGTNR